MNRDHAEGASEGLSRIFEGAFQLADVFVDMKLPQALGLSPAEWAERRLAGPVKLNRDERRRVAPELEAAGMTQRDIAETLGVGLGTVNRDLRDDVPNGTGETSEDAPQRVPEPVPVPNGTPEPEVEPEVELEPERRLGFLMSSASDEWATPQDFFDTLDAEFHFDLDVCALPSSTKCEQYYAPEDDGLAQDWTGVCWMNPPYGQEIASWVRKAHEAGANGATVVCLVPARVDTGWWWDHCRYGEIRFLRGRLAFGDGRQGAPFPSAVVVFGARYPASVKWWDTKSHNTTQEDTV